MYIDYSRYRSFWENPEKYRLVYEQNLHPRTMPYGLARGTAFHRIAELMEAANDNDSPVTVGANIECALIEEGIEELARENAWRMYHAHHAYVNNPHPPKILAMEKEWSLPLITATVENLPAGDTGIHYVCGRVDQIVESDAGVFVLDTKTAHARTQLARVKKEWLTNKQADFLLIGAKALGYEPKCLIIHVILETTPPRVWEITVTRTPAQLEQLKRNALLTISIIQHLRSAFGVDEPWPHLDSQWPCSTTDKCDYRSICGRPTSAFKGTTEIGHFKSRREHLQLIADQKEKAKLDIGIALGILKDDDYFKGLERAEGS